MNSSPFNISFQYGPLRVGVTNTGTVPQALQDLSADSLGLHDMGLEQLDGLAGQMRELLSKIEAEIARRKLP